MTRVSPVLHTHTQSDGCNLAPTIKSRLAKDHLKGNVAVPIIFPFTRDLRQYIYYDHTSFISD